MRNLARRCVFLALIIGLMSPCLALTRIAVTADEISSPSVNAKRLSASLRLTEPAGELSLKIGEFTNNGKRYADTELHCARLTIAPAGIVCKEGKLKESGEVIPLTFQFVRVFGNARRR